MLQAIAADGVIPFINIFSVTNLKGEPRRALYLTATIAETGVLLANVDYIAPIITMYVFHTTTSTRTTTFIFCCFATGRDSKYCDHEIGKFCCMSVGLSAGISQYSYFTKFSVHITCGRGSFLL